MKKMPPSANGGRPTPDGKHLLLADADEYLRWLAISRLYLDNVPNMQSSWVTMGPKVGQLALFYGANDMGSVMMEENVVSQAGASFRLSEDEIRRLITDAGWQPQQRDQYYRPIETERRPRPSKTVSGLPILGSRHRAFDDGRGRVAAFSNARGWPVDPPVSWSFDRRSVVQLPREGMEAAGSTDSVGCDTCDCRVRYSERVLPQALDAMGARRCRSLGPAGDRH